MRSFGFSMLVVALGIGTAACGTDDSCEGTSSCGSSGGGNGGGGGSGNTGATGGTGGSGADGGSCDMTKSPAQEPCLISDAFGVFVSPTGDDTTGNGTQATPYKTLSKAVTEAGQASKNVYACDDGAGFSETDTLTIGAALDGLGIYGGFDCGGWNYSEVNKAKLTGAATAVRIESIPTGFTFENFEVNSTTPTTPGDSSLATVISGSTGVIVRRVKLGAANGANGSIGQNGTSGANGTTPNTHIGVAAKCAAAPPFEAGGDWGADSACGSRGGKGGAAQEEGPGGPGSFGTPQKNVTPADVQNGGAGVSTVGLAFPGGTGQPGSVGNAGTPGPAAASAGTFAGSDFTPANGSPGLDGFPGQGGGGGGASAASTATLNCIGASGGAGGMGGCGGTKGAAGGGGGASVALLSWQSDVTLDSCELTAGNGGDGGKGGDAGAGGSGGPGALGGAGNGVTIAKAGDGGSGGGGGPGGAGSGGTGGPSYALVWKDTAPSKLGTVTLVPGAGGDKGIGGTGATNAADGSDGATGQEFEQP